MRNITFEPHVGVNYATCKPKVLIVGESHYGNGSELNSFTQEVVKMWAMGEAGIRRFFTTLAKLLSDKSNVWMSKEEKKAFWQNVAFYNFIQSIVGENPRIRPTDEMWDNGKLPLAEVLQELNPDIVLILGRELSRHIKQIEPEVNHDITFCYWSHPSAPKYFDKKEAMDTYQKAVENYKNQKG
jgi:hypothetical protein